MAHSGSVARVATAAIVLAMLSVGAALTAEPAVPDPTPASTLAAPDPFPLGTCLHLGPLDPRPLCVLVNPDLP